MVAGREQRLSAILENDTEKDDDGDDSFDKRRETFQFRTIGPTTAVRGISARLLSVNNFHAATNSAVSPEVPSAGFARAVWEADDAEYIKYLRVVN